MCVYIYNVRYMNEHFSMLYSNMRKRRATPSGALPTRPSKATGLASLMLCGVADAYATLIVAHRGPPGLQLVLQLSLSLPCRQGRPLRSLFELHTPLGEASTWPNDLQKFA